MEAGTNSNRKPILIRIADQLVKDQEELDTLAVQLSLGKADVKDQFEEAKKKLRNSVHEFKTAVFEEYHQSKDWSKSLKDKIDHLDEKLGEVKAGTKEKFEEQRQSIQKALEDLRNDIKTNPDVLKVSGFFTSASEKAKLQFEILDKKWEDSQAELMEGFKDGMKTAKFKIAELVEKAKDKKDEMGDKLGDFNDEIHEAYSHLKKAIKSL